MKRSILLVAILLAFNSLFADNLDVERAREFGHKFVKANFEQKENNELDLVYTMKSESGEPCFYVFNVSDYGFVMVSATDVVRPILGYSEGGIFETDNIAPGLGFMMEDYQESISYALEAVIEAPADVKAEWQALETTGKLRPAERGVKIGPLCKTSWDQKWPYNYYCPDLNRPFASNGKSVVGCVATAMSQIMKYWDHPTQGTGSHTYKPDMDTYGYPEQSANFGETTYDWANMPYQINKNSPQEQIEAVKLYLRSKVPDKAKKVGNEQAIKDYAKQFDVPENWCAEAFDEAKQKEDEAYNYSMDLHVEEIHQLRPSARFVMFDACYNGSFHLDDYQAGAYIFNPGKTIATFGSSVNSIQDKWPNEFIGLMAAGMRIGQFTRLTCFLENHLIGDPTFRFKANANVGLDINQALVLKANNIAFWKKQLDSPLADMQALALRMLSDANYKDMASLLEESYFNSPSFVVRLEALRLLALNYPSESVNVIKAGMNDSYELIRRYAAEYAGKNCSPELISTWISTYLQRAHEKRFRFKINRGVDAFPYDIIQAELKKQASEMTLFNADHVNALADLIQRNENGMIRDIETITNPDSKPSHVRRDLRIFRNFPVGGKPLEMLLNFVKDESRPMDQRIIAAEVFGWYGLYYEKESIISTLKEIKTDNAGLANEIQKSIARLESKNR